MLRDKFRHESAVFIFVLIVLSGAGSALAESATMPSVNPYLIQDSVYPSVHFDPATTDATTLPIWPGSSTVEPLQVQWLPGLTTIGTAHRPYLRGEHALFFSGATLGNGVYTVMDIDGIFYAGWCTSVYKVGDVRAGDPFSPIEIAAEFDMRDGLPEDQRDKISRIFGFAMTYDGWLAVAMPGIIAVMDRNLENMKFILFEGEAVDNGISVDDLGGIYCVTSKYMCKVVWDGKKLSDDEADGAFWITGRRMLEEKLS